MAKKESRAQALMGELEEPEISIAAMADILFVLLTFFMSVTTMDVIRTKTEVPLPTAKDAQKGKDRSAWIFLNVLWTPGRGGEIWCDERKYEAPEMLAPVLGQKMRDAGLNTAYIRAALDTQYFYISRLTKVVAEAGIPNVVFGTVASAPDQTKLPPGAAKTKN